MTNTAHMCREGRGRFGWRWPEVFKRRGGEEEATGECSVWCVCVLM